MKEELRKVFTCDYCSKKYFMKHYCAEHEKRCDNNPDNERKCLNGCKYLTMEKEHAYDDFTGRERVVEVFYCSKFKTYMHPPKVEFKGNAFDFGDIPNNPMKKECEHFKYNDDFLDVSFDYG